MPIKDIHLAVKTQLRKSKDRFALEDLLSGKPIREFPSISFVDDNDIAGQYEHWVNIDIPVDSNWFLYAKPSYIFLMESFGATLDKLFETLIVENIPCIYTITDTLNIGMKDINSALLVKLSI